MTGDFAKRLGALSAADKALLVTLAGFALLALLLGLGFGMTTGLARGGFLGPLDDETGYRLMTLHGVDAFFYWLGFAQAFLLLALTVEHAGGASRIGARPAALAGTGAMILGFALSGAGALFGPALLYDAPPELAMDPAFAFAAIHGGYLLLAAGLFLVAWAAIATAVGLRREAGGEWSTVAFAAGSWAGLLMVSAIAAVNAFMPALLWGLGLAAPPAAYSTAWHLLFHNMHYLPLLATVVVWYALVRELTGVRSAFGTNFSKLVFAAYLIFVPPTSLYHMFLEPDLPGTVRTLGSLLSLFIGVPTVLVFLVLTASLEIAARKQGARGLFGWIGKLPWRHPAMAAVGASVVNLALGGAFSFVLIQEKLAPLLSDTFMVPGYFHFLTIGTVTLTFLAGFVVALPPLAGRPLRAPAWLVRLPWLATFGLVIFGAAGVAAGYLGVPRRTISVAYDGLAPPAWPALMAGVGTGAAIMGIAMIAYVAILAASLLLGPRAKIDLPVAAWGGGGTVAAERAWTGPLAVFVLIAAMYAFTALAFNLMRALPVAALGGGH
ncbi:MAG: cbb3-type cytochrome c oxidase subunit I [Rhodospirillales bacterium]|nr:cbb3-type cytochrome c oxidase subunit I [Rhodospirillales bacterium]